MSDRWALDEAYSFWMEKDTPTGMYWHFVFDTLKPSISREHLHFLDFLNKLKIIDYGTIYEAVDCIRIKAHGRLYNTGR